MTNLDTNLDDLEERVNEQIQPRVGESIHNDQKVETLNEQYILRT